MRTAPSDAAPADRPFIVVTLQRTGGTNLFNRLNRRSAFPAASQHEPFNPPRVWGHVTKAWKTNSDRAALQAAMREVCDRGETIKHCVEMVPWPVTAELLAAAMAADFRFMFLYRRDALARLLSMEYAQRTKVWGLSHLDKVAQDATAFETPLDADALAAHERRCGELLDRAWKMLAGAGARPVALAYEDLYGPDSDIAGTALARVLEALHLSRGAAADADLLAELRGEGDQGTRDRYARFEGIGALSAALAGLPGPVFDRTGPAPATAGAP